MMKKQFLQAYGSALDVEVEAASPHKLVLMLFDGALQAIAQATLHIQNGRVAEKGRLISKAIAIVDEGLRASLDHEVGGELSQNLDALYEYCSYQLLQANLRNEPALLAEVGRLLGELRDSWAQISPVAQAVGTAPERISHGTV
jgi:flagellar protein FliS